jgi:hypothetical protein
MIVAFSVFEIISLRKIYGKEEKKNKKVEKKEKKKIIASKIKNSAIDDIEWTYYGDEKKEPSNVIEKPKDIQKHLKFTFLSSLFHKIKILRFPKIFGKQIEKETKIVVKKHLDKDTAGKDKKKKENSKFEQLENYVKDAFSKGASKESIIESCIDSDWPEEMIKKAMKSITLPERKTNILTLYVLSGATFLLALILILTNNLALGYWIELLSMGSKAVYYVIFIFFFGIIIISAFKIYGRLGKKVKVKSIMKQKKVEKIKGEVAKVRKGEIVDNSYKTDIDKLLDIINEKGSLNIEEVAKIFGIEKIEAEAWGKILKDQGLITIYYPTVGDAELKCKKAVKKEEE